MRKFLFSLLFIILFVPFFLSSCKVDDRKILQNVQTAFQEDSLENIQVTVANGVVILSGRTSSSESKKQIEKKIREIGSVRDVENGLSVVSSDSIK